MLESMNISCTSIYYSLFITLDLHTRYSIVNNRMDYMFPAKIFFSISTPNMAILRDLYS